MKTPVLEYLFLKKKKKKLQHRCFPVNIAEFSRTPIFKNICEQLLLGSEKSVQLFAWNFTDLFEMFFRTFFIINCLLFVV